MNEATILLKAKVKSITSMDLIYAKRKGDYLSTQV